MNMSSAVLSEGVVLYFTNGRSPEEVTKKFGQQDGDILIAFARKMLRDAFGVQVDWNKESLESGTDIVGRKLRDMYPDISEEAIDVVTSRFAYEWK